MCLLGEGAFAKVYLCKKNSGIEVSRATGCVIKEGDIMDDRYYAMKVISKTILTQRKFRSYMKLEKRILLEMDH
jgi:serine/threonine protein kinase